MSDRTYNKWYEDEDGSVHIEVYNGMTFFHCTVKHWSISRVKKFKEILEAVCEELKESGTTRLYAYNKNQDYKWEKFCRMFGFSFLGTADNGWKIYKKEC